MYGVYGTVIFTDQSYSIDNNKSKVELFKSYPCAIPNKQNNFFITDNCNIVLGNGFGLAIEFSSLEVPKHSNSSTLHPFWFSPWGPPTDTERPWSNRFLNQVTVTKRHWSAILVRKTDMKTLWPDLVTAVGSSLGFSLDEKQAGIPMVSCMVFSFFLSVKLFQAETTEMEQEKGEKEKRE
ncbi:hypothetical protein GQ457_17G017790 [Hibiscus cannabinus]